MESGAPDPDQRHNILGGSSNRGHIPIADGRYLWITPEDMVLAAFDRDVDPVSFTRGSEAMDVRDGKQQGGEHAANQ